MKGSPSLSENAVTRSARSPSVVASSSETPIRVGEMIRRLMRRVHAGHHGEQHLRGADVAGGLLAADVLLARLQGHAQRGAAGGIPGYSDDAPGYMAPLGLTRREERRVRAAVAHRHAEAL